MFYVKFFKNIYDNGSGDDDDDDDAGQSTLSHHLSKMTCLTFGANFISIFSI